MELVATYPILYRSHQYEVGDSLPADDESMVQAWLDAGTAVWSEGKQEKEKLIYVKADDFGPLPAIGRQIVFDGKRYMVTDSTDEGGVYTITMEANRTK